MAAIQALGIARAAANADSPITLWLRDEAGRLNLAGSPLPVVSVSVRRFGSTSPLVHFPATGDDQGRVAFTITAGDVSRSLSPGAYAYRVTVAGVGVQSGVLEVSA